SGVQAARMIGARGIFDTDDGRSVGVHYWAAAPFAHWVTAPDCLDEPLGRRSVRYPSYKALAYLHPDVFAPNPQVNVSIGLQVGEPYALLRLVAHDASHDRGAVGLSIEHSHRLIGLLEGDMRVFVSAEGQLDASLKDRELRIPPETMHDVLAGARIVVGDSQSVIAEAAVLGTPAVRVNSYTGATPYLVELEEKYGLAFSFTPAAFDEAIALVSSLVAEASTGTEWSRRRDRMLEDKVNLTEWYIRFLTDLESTE
ncbi:MAG TPA: hypothetical protein VFS66_07415, partial [Acidimicrobiia bacterium]|nr:hypothetical protein [Acidimicrobiia bacterium]